MKQDFSVTVSVHQSPQQVFEAVVNVRGWWQGFYDERIEGSSSKVGDDFTFRAGDGAHYSRQKLIELVPNKKVVWIVTESDLSFLARRDEWNGTHIMFEIQEKNNKTDIIFTHKGLKPGVECYDVCTSAWSQYLPGNLLTLLQMKRNS